jgi:hypothetical protein
MAVLRSADAETDILSPTMGNSKSTSLCHHPVKVMTERHQCADVEINARLHPRLRKVLCGWARAGTALAKLSSIVDTDIRRELRFRSLTFLREICGRA